jgi:hypothetical protein
MAAKQSRTRKTGTVDQAAEMVPAEAPALTAPVAAEDLAGALEVLDAKAETATVQPAPTVQSRLGTVAAWHRKSGDVSVSVAGQIPCVWPRTKETGLAQRLASAVLEANRKDKLGLDFTEEEATDLGQKLARKFKKSVTYKAPKAAPKAPQAARAQPQG